MTLGEEKQKSETNEIRGQTGEFMGPATKRKKTRIAILFSFLLAEFRDNLSTCFVRVHLTTAPRFSYKWLPKETARREKEKKRKRFIKLFFFIFNKNTLLRLLYYVITVEEQTKNWKRKKETFDSCSRYKVSLNLMVSWKSHFRQFNWMIFMDVLSSSSSSLLWDSTRKSQIHPVTDYDYYDARA